MLSYNQEMSDKSRYSPWFEPHINTWMFDRTSIGSSLFYSLISSSWEIKLFNNHILFDVIILSIIILITKKILCLFGFYFYLYVIFLCVLFLFLCYLFICFYFYFYVIFLCVLFLFLCVFLLILLLLLLLQLLYLLFILIPMSNCILSCRVV